MPKRNPETDLSPAELRAIAKRITAVAKKFDAVADEVALSESPVIPLSIQTFVDVTLTRLEAFSRTLDKELISHQIADGLLKRAKARRDEQ